MPVAHHQNGTVDKVIALLAELERLVTELRRQLNDETERD